MAHLCVCDSFEYVARGATSSSHGNHYAPPRYRNFVLFSIFTRLLGLVATVLSALTFDGNLTLKNVWGAHFNVGSDVVQLAGAGVGVVCVCRKNGFTIRC